MPQDTVPQSEPPLCLNGGDFVQRQLLRESSR
jgi:hypothetical protein